MSDTPLQQSKEITDDNLRKSRMWKDSYIAFGDFYDEQEEGYNYLQGNQYSEKKKKLWRDVYKRPVEVYPLVSAPLNQVLGDFYLNKQHTRIYPKPGGTMEIADTYKDLIDHYDYESASDFETGRTVLASLIRMGFFSAEWSDKFEIDGSLVTFNIDEFQIVFDLRAKHDFLFDAVFMGRSLWLDNDQMFEKWPHHKDKLKDYIRDWKDKDVWDHITDDAAWMMGNKDFMDERNGKYRVIEWHEMVTKPTEVAFNVQNGESEIFSLKGDKKRALFFKANPDVQIIEQNAKVKEITTFLPGLNFQLEKKDADIQDGIHDIIPLSAYNYSQYRKDAFGMHRIWKSSQDGYNDWTNRVTDILNKAGNVGNIYTPSDFINAFEMHKFGNVPGISAQLKEGKDAQKAFKRLDPPQFPFSEDRMSEKSYEFMFRALGLNPNQMGYSDTKQENASLFAQRVQQGKIALTTVYNNIRRAKQILTQKKIRLIQQNLTFEKYFLITNPETGDQKEFVANMRRGNEIINNRETGEYQVCPDTDDRDPTTKKIRSMERMELARYIVEIYSNPVGAAIDPKWLLEEMPVGDIQELISRIEQIIGMKGQAGQQAEAFDIVNNLMELAKKKGEYEQVGIPAKTAPAK